MRLLTTAAILFSITGCAFLESEDDAILVRVENESAMSFDDVVLDLGNSDESQAVFESVAPGTVTRFQKVRSAFSQPFTVRARTESQEYVFDVVAVVAILLEPGSYTYTMTVNEEKRLWVGRSR